jgi:hypothetical protein
LILLTRSLVTSTDGRWLQAEPLHVAAFRAPI